MKPGIVKGDDARDVAAYVAQAVADEGDDPGRLAAVGVSKAEGTAEEQNGTLDIPVAASGLAYKFADATANAGQVTIKSENPQSDAARHRGRGQRRQRQGRGRRQRRRLRSSAPTSSPASTRSSAPCPATARAAWKASSPSSSGGADGRGHHRDRVVAAEAALRQRPPGEEVQREPDRGAQPRVRRLPARREALLDLRKVARGAAPGSPR